ncbi:hypothetical protein KKC60_01560, partial [Patescibacteria group bacterium]|nr:hypothetical protein [Patescibacteria group bacterium]
KTLATKKEIEKLATREEMKTLATKKEIEKLATREEMKTLATKKEIKDLEISTKDEIKDLATKKDIEKLVTKEEHHELIRFLQDHMVTKKDLEKTESKVGTIESTMVTKDFLEEKIADLRGDFVLLSRKGNDKLFCLIEILGQKKVLNKSEITRLEELKPFPKAI